MTHATRGGSRFRYPALTATLPSMLRGLAWAAAGLLASAPPSLGAAKPDAPPAAPALSAADSAAAVEEYTAADDPFAGAAGSETGRAAEASPLLRDAARVVAGDFAGVDTAALFRALEEKSKWGELPERLLEARGILLWRRGEPHLALASLRRLAKPGPVALGMMAEGMARKGDRYEAAALHLRAARAFGPADPMAPEAYARYLAIKPGDAAVEAELADRLENLGRYPEAAALRLKDPARALATPASALRVGALFASQGRPDAALALYRDAVAKHPQDKALRVRLAGACEYLGMRLEAGQAFAAAWDLDPQDRTLRDRALAHFEAAGPAAEGPLRELLAKSISSGDDRPRLQFKLAVASLAAGDRSAAYLHLGEALKSDPNNPTYLARLPEAIEDDSLIWAHFPVLKSEYERRGGSARLAEVVARGYALAGKPQDACRAWNQAYTLEPARLAGRREAILSLGGCGEAAFLPAAGRLAEPLFAKDASDREVGAVLLRAQAGEGRHDAAAKTAARLVEAHPEEAPLALSTAKAFLAEGRTAPAADILQALVRAAPGGEPAFLLGRLRHGQKDCAAAVPLLETASEAHPEANRLLGECLEAADPARAALAYESIQNRTGDKESLLALARTRRAAGDLAREKEALADLVARRWAGEGERLRFGHVHLALGDSAQAADVFEELLKGRVALPAEPAWTEAAFVLGTRHSAEGRHDKAVRPLTLALRADSGRAAAWRALGESQFARRQWRPAFEALTAAWAAGGPSPELARMLVEASRKLGGKKEQAAAYGKLLEVSPDDPDATAYLAAWHLGERHYRDAAHHYRRLAEARPDDMDAWERYGNCLAMLSEFPAAGEALQKALDLGAASDEVYLNRARAYRHEGAKDMAASIMEFLASRNSRSQLALLWSAKFAEEDGNSRLAMELYKKASRLPAPRTAWPELASQGVASASVRP